MLLNKMSGKRQKKVRINVLEDITIKTAVNNATSGVTSTTKNRNNCLISNEYKENNFVYTNVNVENNSGRRYTASMAVFDEEPVFSDSDEEREYNKKIYESKNLMTFSNERPKKVSVAVQCNLPYETDILNLVKKCAILNSDDATNAEFKELIQLCRRLNYKNQYVTPPSSVDETVITTINDNETQDQLKNKNLQISSIQNRRSNISSEFLPSRQSSDDFLSECMTFENNKLQVSKINKSSCKDGFNSSKPYQNRVNTVRSTSLSTVRRSTRLRKSNKRNKSRVLTGRDRVQKTQKRLNTRNLRQRITKVLNKQTTNLYRNNRKCVKAKKVDNIMLDFILKNKSKHKSEELHESSHDTGSLDNSIDEMYINIPLPKKYVRSLARNWLKTNRGIRNCVLTDFKFQNISPRQRVRRLYSPTEWLRSKEFANLCEK